MKCKLTSFAKRKAAGEQIVMCTAYDAPFAKLVSGAGIDVILVGDSVGTTLLGFESTVPVTMSDMLRHTAAVRRGAPEAFVVFDMPFMSYQASTAEALHNAAQALKECGADAVKLEGGAAYADLVREMVRAGIPVMGHIGLMPQRVQVSGGYKIVGKARFFRDSFDYFFVVKGYTEFLCNKLAYVLASAAVFTADSDYFTHDLCPFL